jgi:hypothetical protein
MIDTLPDNQSGMPPSADFIATPFLLDLANITQEQFDRAISKRLAATGASPCHYSAPCILGAAMPQELVDQLVAMKHDSSGITRLATAQLVVFKDGIEQSRADHVQWAFDVYASQPERSKAIFEMYLPHLDHSGY